MLVYAGEEASFEAIFKRHYSPLLAYCRHMLGDMDEAEDALQQCFIRAHKALVSHPPPRDLRPWLYKIARNCCLSAIAARRQTLSLEDHEPSLSGLSDEVHRREDLRELLSDVGRLPEEQRSALLLAELEDLSHEAIAAVVGCPVSKVKALVYQARCTLIAERDARNASCEEIRQQLSVATGGALRRGPLRRHLRLCTGCRDFQEAVSVQRQSLAIALPVLPSAAFVAKILGGAAGGGVAATSAGVATGGGVAAGGGASLAASTATGAGAAASAGSAGGGASAILGGGMVVKAAVTGAVALATVGAVAGGTRLTHAGTRGGVPSRQIAAVSPPPPHLGSHRALQTPGTSSAPDALSPAGGSQTSSGPSESDAVALRPGETSEVSLPAATTVLASSEPAASISEPAQSSSEAAGSAPEVLGAATGERQARSAARRSARHERLEQRRAAQRARRLARKRRREAQRLRRQARLQRQRELRRERELEHQQELKRLRELRRLQRIAARPAPAVPVPAPVVRPTKATRLSATTVTSTTTTSSTSTSSTSSGETKAEEQRKLEALRRRRRERREELATSSSAPEAQASGQPSS